jgi:hypothetical protein
VSSWSGPSGASVADDELAAFLQSAELATVHLYEVGAALITSPAAVRATAACAAHHRAHAAVLATLAGPSAATGPNAALLTNLAPSLQVLSSEADELGFLYSLESQLAGTYEWALSHFTGVPAVQQAATILPVECQHAVELGLLLSKPLSDLVGVFQADDGYLDPHEFPLP